MKKSIHFIGTGLILAATLLCSCQRKPAQVLEDSKTAGRYVGRGFRALAGLHDESRQFGSAAEFAGPTDEEFIPLRDEDLSRQIAKGDPRALQQLSEHSAVPQSALTPGDAASGIPGIDGFFEPKGQLSSIFRNLHYETNDYVIRGQENEEIVRSVANYLKTHPNTYLFIEGHCDERGTAAYNLALGSQRASGVRNLLIKEGVDLNRVFTISYGKERPLALSSALEDLAVNRRAQFKIYEKR